MADEHDLGSCARKGVRVRVPPSPPLVSCQANQLFHLFASRLRSKEVGYGCVYAEPTGVGA